MQTELWQSIQDADYAIPEGHTLQDLTRDLVAHIGTTDGPTREATYDILSEWILAGNYSADELRALAATLTDNLHVGLGEPTGDDVFGRAFSVLLLGEVVNYDNDAHVLAKDDVTGIANAVADYLRDEKDERGQVEGKGWAHALHHSEMALRDIAASAHIDAATRELIAERLSARGLSLAAPEEEAE